MKKKRSSAVRSGTPGRAGERRAQVAQVAARSARKRSDRSGKKSAPANGTDKATRKTNGPPPANPPPSGKTRRPGPNAKPDSLDWRYLQSYEWPIVIDAINYYLSTHVSAESRAPIENVREQLSAQAPSV